MPDEAYRRHPLLEFSIEGFRCFRDRANFDEPRHVNVLAGPNNSGKSSLLAVLRGLTTKNHLPPKVYRGSGASGSADPGHDMRFQRRDVATSVTSFAIMFPRLLGGAAGINETSPVVRLQTNPNMPPNDPGPLGLRGDLLGDPLLSPQDAYWKRHAEIWGLVNPAIGQILFLPTVRRVGSWLHEDDLPEPREAMFDGSAILSKLLAYTNPSHEHEPDSDSHRLSGIESTMSSLVGKSVKLRALPVERDVEVSINGRPVALKRLGAGIEQLLILAFAFAEHPEALLLIEEPENFLHPRLQRRVLEHLLVRKGDSIVTTHSNHLLDVRDERLGYYRTYVKPDGTSGLERTNSLRKYDFLWDLGVRPSSLFESNATIWVEGPSDAILLRAWLRLLPEAKGLVEGVHYCFAFHAGSLLDKFFIDWNDEKKPDAQYIVNFCALHPNFFIVADSDGTPERAYGHGYLERIADKAKEKGLLWVTNGKEIENYLPQSVLEAYLTKRASPHKEIKSSPTPNDLRWKPIWKILNILCGQDFYSDYPVKVAFAEWAASELAPLESDAALDVLDLRARLRELVAFVWRASGKEPTAEAELSVPSL